MSIFEYSYFDYIVIHVYIEKEKVYTKKEIGKFQNFIELLAALPQILNVVSPSKNLLKNRN